MGDEQASFASSLLNAEQFRGSEWTTGTVIIKGPYEGAEGAHGDGKKRKEKMKQLLEEYDERLARQGHRALGFAEGDEGAVQAAHYRQGFSRWMRPHGDTEDWLVKGMDFLDGLA